MGQWQERSRGGATALRRPQSGGLREDLRGAGRARRLGRHVARLEARVAIEEILDVMPDYEVDLAGARRLYTEFVQGFGSLPLTFQPW